MKASIYCPHCHKHTELSSATQDVEYNSGYGTKYKTVNLVWFSHNKDYWWIGICNSCYSPSLVLNMGDIVYPTPLQKPSDNNIPDHIRRDLDEAKMTHSVNCFRASAVMSRRVIQQACLEKGASPKKNLYQQIEELYKNGEITKNLEESATIIRWIGNDGAHPNDNENAEVTEEDSQDCLDLAEQLLHVLFVVPAVTQARRKARGK